jgi:hypothetical protein
MHLATQTMALDTFNAGGEGLDWTMQSSGNGNPTAASLNTYFTALTTNNYLSQADLKKLLTAPGKGPGNNPPSASNSCFTFFAISGSSPSDQPLLVTANWNSSALDAKATPYGKKGFVVFNKGGSGGIHTRVDDVTNTNFFPHGTSSDGQSYAYEPLK